MIYNIGICDDETEYRKMTVEELLKSAKKCETDVTVQEFSSGEEFLSSMGNEEKMDMIILDIDMPGMNGLDIAKEIRKQNLKIVLVFLSGYDDYVFESFEVEPLSFIRKRFMRQEMYPTFIHALPRMQQNKNIDLRLEDENHCMVMVKSNDLIYADLYRHEMNFHVNDGRILRARQSMKDLQKELNNGKFVLLSSGVIVNVSRIKSCGKKQIVLDNGECLNIARGKYDGVYQAYCDYWRNES